jgi:RNA polymerase sigma-70 factor, ECF subfamily
MTNDTTTEQVAKQIDFLYRTESRRIFASLVRLLGDFDLAEDALQDAFRVAIERWPTQGVPDNPRAWLISAGRFKAIDGLRRHARSESPLDELAERQTSDPLVRNAMELGDGDIEDDRLRLIFTCCHPALPQDARVALTLREVCGLTTEAIAHAYLTTPTTLAQRIVRAKARIREAHVPYEVPSRQELPERLEAVLQVIYLVFNEGYSTSSGESLTRTDLSAEAIHLGRLLVRLMPDPEAIGLLALMLLHESRHAARTDAQGDMILLEDQDRSLWNRSQITEGTALVRGALTAGQAGPYTLQAVIAAVHASAPSFSATDWAQIVTAYDLLLQITHSPVIELNRAVAVAMRDGPAAGLALIDAILARGDLADYPLAYSARAELCRQMERTAEARAAYRQALDLTQPGPRRRFLEQRLAGLPG